MDEFLKGFQLPDLSYRIPDVNLDLDLIDESASGLLEHLDKMIASWRQELPQDAQPFILAILSNGAVIEAREFSEAGHNGIGIRGRLSDGSECLVMTHQANLQLLCRVVKTEDVKQRYPIGFNYGRRK